MYETTEADIQQQIDLENRAVDMGHDRYMKERPLPWRGEAGKKSEESMLPPGRQLLQRALEPTVKTIAEWIEEVANSGQAGNHNSAFKLIRDIDPEVMAYIACRSGINSAAQMAVFQQAARDCAKALEDHLNMVELKEADKGLHYAMTQSQKGAGTNPARRMRNIKRLMDERNIQRTRWEPKEQLRVGTKLLFLFCEATGFAEQQASNESRRRTVRLVPTKAVSEWLEKAHARCALLAPVYMPMVVPPQDWTSPNDGGYLTLRAPMVKSRNRNYLDDLKAVSMPAIYEALNRMQSVAWEVNRQVLDVMTEVWESGISLGSMPKREGEELPAKPGDIDSNEDARKAWAREAAVVHRKNAHGLSQRLAQAQKMWIAEELSGRPIWFPMQLDFRGRVYPMPLLLHPQGDDASRSLLRFHEGKPLGERGAYWLAVHIAGLFGVDKVSFDERVAWVRENEDRILDSAFQPLNGERFWTTADDGKKAWQALAACFEWAGYRVQGTSFVSHIPVALDGSCSGLQHFSALLRDPEGGAAVNLMPADKPQDVYQRVADRAEEIIAASSDPQAAWWAGKVVRKIAKQPTMTYCYSATRYGMSKMILNALDKLDDTCAPEKYLPEANSNFEAAQWLSYVLWQAISDVVRAATSAMEWLRNSAKVAAAEGIPVRWTTPLGFPVLQEYTQTESQRVKVNWGGRVQRFSLASSTNKIDTRAQANGVSPNFVHSLDASHLMLTVLGCADMGINDLALIHDSFGTHAADVDILSAVLRDGMVEMYSSPIMENLREEVLSQLPDGVELPELPPTGDLDLEEIKKAQYSFA